MVRACVVMRSDAKAECGLSEAARMGTDITKSGHAQCECREERTLPRAFMAQERPASVVAQMARPGNRNPHSVPTGQ